MHSRRKAWLLLIVILVAFLSAQTVTAQTVNRLTLTSLDSSKFPQMDFYLEAYDEGGQFLDHLSMNELRVLENNSIRPLNSLKREEHGTQVIIVYNDSSPMAKLSGKVSLFDLTRQALISWINETPVNPQDDWSLVTNRGLQVIHSNEANEWEQALQNYQPDLLLSKPSLNSLAQGLELAAEPNSDPLMKRMLLYITPLLSPTYQTAMPNLAAHARALGIQINIWLIGIPADANSIAGQALNGMTVQTGGSMFIFSGGETLPNLAEYIQPLRQIYHGSYTSAIQNSGRQTVSIQLVRDTLTFTSNQYNFDLTVTPPNPILLSPPRRIEFSTSYEKDTKSTQILSPDQYTLKIAVEFVDGHPRALTRSELMVDGIVVEQHTQPPFDSFVLPLETLTTSSQHTLQVRIVDCLGLSQSTVLWPVEVMITEPPPRLPTLSIFTSRFEIAILVLSSMAALTVIVVTKMRRLSKIQVTKPIRRSMRGPADTQEESSHQGVAAFNDPVPDIRLSPNAPACLIRLEGDEITQPVERIPIAYREQTFGSNPKLALYVLNSPSVSPIHARLFHTSGDDYILYDAGSLTGTWVNYNSVFISGVKLRHGDLIHFGRMTFRFELYNPDCIPQAGIVSRPEDLL